MSVTLMLLIVGAVLGAPVWLVIGYLIGRYRTNKKGKS